MTIQDYGKEIDIPDLTLEQLIDSHRRLREMSRDFLKKEREAYDAAYKRSYVDCVKNNFLSKDQLQKMTLKELLDSLYSE